MQDMPFMEFAKGVLLNLFVLLAFVALCGMVRAWSTRHRRRIPAWHTGLLFGLLAVVAMLFPVVTQRGMIFDCRAGVLGAASLLGGPWAALASLPLPLAYRLHVGGEGALPGVAEMILPALIGTLLHLRCRLRQKDITVRCVVVSSLIVGFGTNVPILACLLVWMPESAASLGVAELALVISNTTVSMALLGALIVIEQEHLDAVASREDSDRRVQHSQKMAAIGQFAGNVAHSFTNAMTSILANAQMAKDKAGTAPDVTKLLDEVIETVGRLSRLTGELLAFAHPGPVRMRRMDLSRCLAGMEELLERAAGSTVKLVIDANRKAGTVNVDPDLIGQAVVHMVVNASDAMPQGGRLVIAASRAALSKEETNALQADRLEGDRHQGDFAVLSVSDTGCGMAADTVSHAFEPFFTTKRDRGNVGLGLTTVYSIVERHNGYIDIRSRPDEGATFLVYLPIVEE